MYHDAAIQRDSLASTEADVALHNHIVHSTSSSTLIRLVESSCILTATLFNARIRAASANIQADPNVHETLFDALTDGDPEEAERQGRAHVREAYAKLAAIKSNGG
jgi:DNA-binding FadR family transcriptional regulator